MNYESLSERYQTRYWILIYSEFFDPTEYERFIVGKDVESLTIFRTDKNESEKKTIVFISYSLTKEMRYNKNTFELIGPKDFKNPSTPIIQKRSGREDFFFFLKSVKSNSSEFKKCDIVLGDSTGQAKFYGRKDLKYFLKYQIENLVDLPDSQTAEFYEAFNLFLEDVLNQAAVFLSYFAEIFKNPSLESLHGIFDKFLLDYKSDFVLFGKAINTLLERYPYIDQTKLTKKLSLKEETKSLNQNERVTNKEDVLAPKVVFNFSNSDYEKLKKQLIADNYQQIDFVSIFKIDSKIFTKFLQTILDQEQVDFKNTNNTVLRFLGMEFGDTKPFKTPLRSNDKPAWFQKIYPYIPEKYKDKYSRNYKNIKK